MTRPFDADFNVMALRVSGYPQRLKQNSSYGNHGIGMSTTIVNTKRIANFEINELIGSGGMANIYKAMQLSLERPVALKVLHRHLTMNENFITRFEKEAKRAAMLHHENIVSIIDYGCHDGEYFIAMEYIEGQNLKQMMTRMKRLPLEVALLIGREVANGLKYAHGFGLIHRDIKPANIMLSSDGRVMITDFGIAKDHQDMSITDTGQMVGSPAYMSPEQAAGRPVDHRCDLFSLGIVLYEIITGEKPFKGENYQELVTNIISTIPLPMKEIRVDVTASIESIIQKCLSKDIESRYQDADVVAADLDEEISHYVIQPSKKLMCEFIKNPIQITEKLRADRISKHTEKALYFMNLGQGRLADATREFENVLRFDKNNKVAQKYLNQLKIGKTVEIRSARGKAWTNPYWLMAGLGALVVCAIVVLGILGSRQKPVVIQTAEQASNQELAIGQKPANLVAEGKNARQSGGQPVNANIKQTGALKTRPVNTIGNNSEKNPTGNQAVSGYNYPNQNLAEFGLLEMISTPEADIYVDNDKYGRTCGPAIKLATGRHFIQVQKEGYRFSEKRIFIESGKTMKISIVLQKD
jgi:serine/threonine protein kinase